MKQFADKDIFLPTKRFQTKHTTLHKVFYLKGGFAVCLTSELVDLGAEKRREAEKVLAEAEKEQDELFN